MRKVSLFIAVSLDGYIADVDGKVDWLEGQESTGAESESYDNFIKDIDTVIMGWNTYNQIITELSPDEWVYSGLKTYVITHKEMESGDEVLFTDKNPVELIKKLKSETGKDIWICGGASIAQVLIRENLIDRYHITVIPTLLGKGIRLFDYGKNEIKLRLVETHSCNGMVDLIYIRR